MSDTNFASKVMIGGIIYYLSETKQNPAMPQYWDGIYRAVRGQGYDPDKKFTTLSAASSRQYACN